MLFRSCLSSYREGLPKVLLEAAASARPIVTTDTVGCRDVVYHDINGLLVPPRSSKKLAEAISKLLADPELRRRMGLKGRELVEKHFSQEKIVRETVSLYITLLAEI